MPAARSEDNQSANTRQRLGPYFFLRARPFREARIRGYIVAQHRLGRGLAEILADAHLKRLGSPTLIWRVVCHPETIAALEADVVTDIAACRSMLLPGRPPSEGDLH